MWLKYSASITRSFNNFNYQRVKAILTFIKFSLFFIRLVVSETLFILYALMWLTKIYSSIFRSNGIIIALLTARFSILLSIVRKHS